jgi:hypothetical protein
MRLAQINVSWIMVSRGISVTMGNQNTSQITSDSQTISQSAIDSPSAAFSASESATTGIACPENIQVNLNVSNTEREEDGQEEELESDEDSEGG